MAMARLLRSGAGDNIPDDFIVDRTSPQVKAPARAGLARCAGRCVYMGQWVSSVGRPWPAGAPMCSASPAASFCRGQLNLSPGATVTLDDTEELIVDGERVRGTYHFAPIPERGGVNARSGPPADHRSRLGLVTVSHSGLTGVSAETPGSGWAYLLGDERRGAHRWPRARAHR